MQISFFEEFPTSKNLEKLKFIGWPTKLYLAANNVKEFEKLKHQYKKYTLVKEWIYWPVLEKKEGYWISPFSHRKALQRIFQELQGKIIPLMLDLEFPTTQNPFLYFTQALFFFANKKLIASFIENYPGQLYLAEYYPEGKKQERLLEKLGLHFSSKKVKIIKMMYHSSHHFSRNFMRKKTQQGLQEHGKNFLLGLGILAPGMGSEPLISPQQLEEDLTLAEEVGVREVILFRLGGLQRKYLKVLEKMV